MRCYNLTKSMHQHSPPTKPGRSSNRDSEQKEIDEFEEEERRLLELDQQVREFSCIYLHRFNKCLCYIFIGYRAQASLKLSSILLYVALLLMFDL